MFTLGQAAKETGVSKTAIARAIKSGRLSASKNDLGEYQIDPAELFRVYPVTGNVDSGAEHHATPKDYGGLHQQSHPQLEALREVLRQIEGERDDLRRRLDDEAAERRQSAGEIRRLTLLLTDQRQPTAPPQAEPEPPRAAYFLGAAPWLWAFLALAASGATAWLWWTGQH